MKKIKLISFLIVLYSSYGYSEEPTKIVTGYGGAECPAGYVLMSYNQSKNSRASSFGRYVYSSRAAFMGCSSVSTTGVSGCSSMGFYDDNGDGSAESITTIRVEIEYEPQMKLICAKTCGN